MLLSTFDWLIVGVYFIFSLAIGIWASNKAGKNTQSFLQAEICHGGYWEFQWLQLHFQPIHPI